MKKSAQNGPGQGGTRPPKPRTSARKGSHASQQGPMTQICTSFLWRRKYVYDAERMPTGSSVAIIPPTHYIVSHALPEPALRARECEEEVVRSLPANP